MNYYSLLFTLLASISSLQAMDQKPQAPQPDQQPAAAQIQPAQAKPWFWKRAINYVKGQRPAQQPVAAQPATPAAPQQPGMFRRGLNHLTATSDAVKQLPAQIKAVLDVANNKSKELTDTVKDSVEKVNRNISKNIPLLIKQTAFVGLGAFMIGASILKLGIPAIKLYTKQKNSWRQYAGATLGLSTIGLGLIAKSKLLASWLS